MSQVDQKDNFVAMTDVCLVDRWSSVLSRGGSFFLEPDADLEDSKSHCPMYTPCHKVLINDDAVLKDEYSKCFLPFHFISCSLCLSLRAVLCLHDVYFHPELLP